MAIQSPLYLTGGEKGDVSHFPILLRLGSDIDARTAVADKGYASNANRQPARPRGIVQVILRKADEKGKSGCFAKAIYKGSARNRAAVGKLKRFKRVVLRAKRRGGTSGPSSLSPQTSSWSNLYTV